MQHSLRTMAGPRCVAALIVGSCMAQLAAVADGDDWPRWRGPQGDGMWRESGIVERFPEGGPPIVWRAPIGPGYSGPAVVGDRVYVTDRQRAKGADGEFLRPKDGAILGTERIVCLNAIDGAAVWQKEYDCPYRIDYPLGPRTTPLVIDGHVYTLGAMGHLYCCDAAGGEVVWSKDLAAEYQAQPPVWGWSANLIVDGDKLVCLVGGEGSAVVALDRMTGAERWRALSAEEIGYSTPIVIEAGGARQLIVWLDTRVCALDPDSGEVLWTHSHPESAAPQRPIVHIASPSFDGEWLMVSEHYQGSMMLKLSGDRPAAEVQWRSDWPNPAVPDDINAMLGTSIIRDGHVYGVTSSGILRCLRVETGEAVWETLEPIGGRRLIFASLFIVPQGDRDLLFTDLGDLIVARLTPDGYDELDRAHLIEPLSAARGRLVAWSHPAFARRCVFARNDQEIVCASLAAADGSESADRESPKS